MAAATGQREGRDEPVGGNLGHRYHHETPGNVDAIRPNVLLLPQADQVRGCRKKEQRHQCDKRWKPEESPQCDTPHLRTGWPRFGLSAGEKPTCGVMFDLRRLT